MIKAFLRCRNTLFSALFLFSLLSSCIKNDDGGPIESSDPLQPAGEITTTVMGTVVDENGQPIEGVEVSVHGESTTTAADGAFHFGNIAVPGNRFIISTYKEGYFNSIKAIAPHNKKEVSALLMLMDKGTPQSLEAAVGGKVTLDNGCEVQIPANGVVTSEGESYSGNIHLNVRYLNPTSDAFGIAVPGGDMLARRTDQSISILYSYGILRVLLTGDSGEDLQLAPGKESTIIMSIPDAQLSTAPPTIPLWYFDEEKGYWVEEGSAQKQGNQYIGTVTHFTDWNCDDPKKWATIVGRLVDCKGDPAGGNIGFGQETSDVIADTDSDSESGKFEMRVPAGITIPVVIQNPLEIPHLDRSTSGKVIVIVPPLAEGQVYNVGDLKPHPCTSTIKGRFKSIKGERVKSMSFESQRGSLFITNIAETFTLRGFPPDTDLTLTIKTESGKTITKAITTPEPGGSLDLGEIVLDQDISLTENSFIIEGSGFSSEKFVFNSQFEPKGWFLTNDNLTILSVGGSAENLEFSLQFEGNSPNVTEAVASHIKIVDPGRGTFDFYNKRDSPVKITITRYDPIGGIIEGTYSGTYNRWEDGGITTEATIKEGKFSVTRVSE